MIVSIAQYLLVTVIFVNGRMVSAKKTKGVVDKPVLKIDNFPKNGGHILSNVMMIKANNYWPFIVVHLPF